ncbi:MAG: hypothetical protein ACRCVT_06770, partial [Leadbetterella sp.]
MNAALASIIFSKDVLYFRPEKMTITEGKQADKVTVQPKEEVLQVVKKTITSPIEEQILVTNVPPKADFYIPIRKNTEPNLVVIVSVFSVELEAFLGKILESLQKNIDDVNIYHVSELQTIDIKKIIKTTPAIFSFGVP